MLLKIITALYLIILNSSLNQALVILRALLEDKFPSRNGFVDVSNQLRERGSTLPFSEVESLRDIF